jgi:hypothetical protein
MLVIDYEKRYDDYLKKRMEALRNDSNKWFVDNWLVNQLVNKYEYFATFQFDKNWVKDKSFDEISNTIKHYKNILHNKLFRRQEFQLNFFPVIETIKWNKKIKKYLPVRPHAHILLSEIPSTARLNCDPKTFFIKCWLEMKNSGLAKDQQVIEIYGGDTTKSAESYITKLIHQNDKNNGNRNDIEFIDTKNWYEVKQVFDEDKTDWSSCISKDVDEDITDWIDRHSENILASNLSK